MENPDIKSKAHLISEIDKLKSKVAELGKIKQELHTNQIHYTEKAEFSQNRFEDMVNSTDGIVWEADAQTFQFSYISDKAERLLGYPIKDWYKPGFWAKHILDSDREQAVNHCASFTKKMLAHDFEYRFVAKNGTVFWLRDLVSVVTKDGKPFKLRGIMIDITKQKHIENELIKSEQKLLESHEITNLGTFIFDDSTDLFESSNICDKILGIDSSFIKDIQGWISLVHPEDYEKVQLLFDNNSLTSIFQELRIVHPKDKKTIWILGHAKKEYDNKGVRTKITGTIQDITHQKLIEEKSKNLNNRLSISIASMPNAYILLDNKLHVTEWNKAAEKIFGYSKHEMLGKNPVNYIVPKKNRTIVNDVLKKLKIGEVASYSAKDNNIRKDGKIISCHWSNAPLVDENDTVFGVLILAKDVTQILQTEKELNKLSKAVEQSANTVVITDTKGNVEFINPKFTELTGYTEADIIGKNQRILKSGNQSEALYANMWQTITSGNVWQGEFQNKSKSGNLFWEYITVTPIKDEDGKIINFLGIKEDITVQILAQQALKESEEKYQDLYDNAPDMFVSVCPKTANILQCNETLLNKLGYTRKEVIGKPVFNVYHPDCMDSVHKVFKLFTEKGEVNNAELLLKRKDGSKVEVILNATAVRDEQGNIIASRSSCRDISKRKIIEQKLKKSKEFNKAVTQTAADAIITSNLEGYVMSWNNAAESLFGYSNAEIINKKITKIIPSKFRKDHRMGMELLKNGSVQTLKSESRELIGLNKDGEEFPIELSLSNWEVDNEKFVTCIIRDITKRKKIEQELLKKTQKLNNHIINTPLAAIYLDRQSIIKEWNLAAENIFGYTAKEAIGKNIIDLVIPKNQVPETNAKCNTFFSDNGGDISFNQNITKQGNTIYCNWYNTIIKDKNNNPIGSASLVDDITVKYNLESTIKQIEKNSALKVGKDYYNTLAKELNKILKADYIIIAEYNNKDNTSNSLSYLNKQTILPNIIYDLAHTPCDIVSKKGYCFYSKDVAEIFSKDSYLKEFNITGYLGIAIYNDEKQIIGQVVAMYCKPITDHDHIKTLLTIFSDKVSTEIERNKLLVKILENKKILLKAQEVAKLGTYTLDIKNFIWTSSDILNTIFGIGKTYKKDKKGWDKLIHPKDKENIRAYFEKNIMQNHEAFNKEYRIVNPSTKETKWIHGLGELEYDNNGSILRLIGTVQDITKRKETDEILHENQHRLSSIYNTVEDIIFYLDVISKGVYKFNSINNSFCNTIGLSKDMVIGKLVNEVIPEPSLSVVLKKYQEAITKKTIIRWEETTNYPTGELTGEVSIAPIFDTNGQCTHLVGSVHDITKRKKSEKVIKENEEFLNITGEIAKVGGWELDLDSKKVKWTLETKRIHEVTKNYLPNLQTVINFYHIDDREMVNKNVNLAIEKGKSFAFEARIITAKGNKKWIKAQGETVIKDGKSIRVYGSFQDISEYKKIENELGEYRKQIETENVFLKKEISLSFNYEDMVYSSSEISEVLTQVEQVSSTDATVLILGETGTGKELIAKAIHNTSDRKNNPLIRVNCAAIPTELIESELFGHIKGSFTGAINHRIGKFELANGGTLFLDEIGEMPIALQPKLLRAIQEGEIEPIGSSKIKKLDVRIIAATNKNLQKEIEEKQFREDLYFRLNVFPITVPALRERTDDIPVLIDHFVSKFCKKHRRNIKYISDETLQQMKSYTWPGNIRELENLIERAVIISNQELLIINEFKTSGKKKTIIKHNSTTLEEVQRNHILKILNKTQWKIDGKTGAAVLLGMKPSTLRDRMKKLGIHRPKK